jgi:hypothetical protein
MLLSGSRFVVGKEKNDRPYELCSIKDADPPKHNTYTKAAQKKVHLVLSPRKVVTSWTLTVQSNWTKDAARNHVVESCDRTEEEPRGDNQHPCITNSPKDF